MVLVTMIETPEYKIFVDLDGVLSDLGKGLAKILDTPVDIHNDLPDDVWKVIVQDCGMGHRLWENLDLLPDAMKLWKYVSAYHPLILTATGPDVESIPDYFYRVGDQKRVWVRRHLGYDVPVHVVRYAERKCEFAGKNKILIDDKVAAIDPWIGEGGIGIMHTSAIDTITQLQVLGL